MKIKFIILLFTSIWLALIVRVFFLAVQSNSYYARLSQQNTIKHEKIAPVRGEIVDIKNRPIAINTAATKRSAASGIHTQAGSAVSATQINGRLRDTGSHMAIRYTPYKINLDKK